MVDFGVKLAENALDLRAIKLKPQKPFKWASGYNMPIYNDNRLLNKSLKCRQLVDTGLADLVRRHKIKCDVVAGTSTAGISWARELADTLETPFIYIRDKPKDHGTRSQIEGIDSDETLNGRNVIVVEDLVSTGGSSLKAVQAVRNIGGRCNNLLSIFNYGLPEAEQMFADSDCKLHSVLTYDTLMKVVRKHKYFSSSQLKLLEEWRADPFNWGAKHGFPKGEIKTFRQKWLEIVQRKNSNLCVGLDPAEPGQRPDVTLPHGVSKLDWCLEFLEKVAPYAAGCKPNRNYIKDFSRKETQTLVNRIHSLDMVALDDSKLVDIGDTNDSGLYHSMMEGFDSVTYAPFPGNTMEAVNQAHSRGLGLIPLVLMSNKQFEPIKNSTIRGLKGYEYFALQAAEYGADAIVVGAPSPDNHISDTEVRRVYQIVGPKLVLMPGVGAQGGDAQYIISIFGAENVIANVGRAIMTAYRPDKAAMKYRDMLNLLRKAA